MIGPISNAALRSVSTSAGNINPPARADQEMNIQDLLQLVLLALVHADGKLAVVAAYGAGGWTLTITTNARVVTIGPAPWGTDAVNGVIDFVAREYALRAGI